MASSEGAVQSVALLCGLGLFVCVKKLIYKIYIHTYMSSTGCAYSKVDLKNRVSRSMAANCLALPLVDTSQTHQDLRG